MIEILLRLGFLRLASSIIDTNTHGFISANLIDYKRTQNIGVSGFHSSYAHILKVSAQRQ